MSQSPQPLRPDADAVWARIRAALPPALQARLDTDPAWVNRIRAEVRRGIGFYASLWPLLDRASEEFSLGRDAWNNAQEDTLEAFAEELDHADRDKDRISRRFELYKLPMSTLVPVLRDYRDAQASFVPNGVNVWTDAPKDYDHGSAFRTSDHVLLTTLGNRTYTRVVVPQEALEWSRYRYSSGNHVAMDDAQMAEQQAYEAKRLRLAVSDEVIKQARALVAEAADIIPAKYENGYWQSGIPTVNYRPKEVPPADPTRARDLLAQALGLWKPLPEETRTEYWRIGSDIEDLDRLGQRAEAKQAEDQAAAATAQAEFERKLDPLRPALVGSPERHVLVIGSYDSYARRMVPQVCLGQIQRMPAGKYGNFHTEVRFLGAEPWASGKMPLLALPDPFDTPAAVWQAGALPGEHQFIRRVVDGAPLFGWKIGGGSSPWKVVRADGSTVPKNSRAYAVFTSEDPGSAARSNAVINTALDGLSKDHRGIFRSEWMDLQVEHSSQPGTYLQVQAHPPRKIPSSPKSRYEGWLLRFRQVYRVMEGDPLSVKWVVLRHASKPDSYGFYWMSDSEPHIPEIDTFLEAYGPEDAARRPVVSWLAADPRRTVEDARQAFPPPLAT